MDYKLENKKYKEMKESITSYHIVHGRYPNYYTIPFLKLRVNKADFQDAINRYEAFKKKNGKEPNYVTLRNVYKISVELTKNSTWLRMEKALGGQFSNIKEFYSLLMKKQYKYYYNDVYPQSVAFNRLEQNLGLNCADISQLVYAVLGSMGYKPNYWRGRFDCGGHIWVTYEGDVYNKNVFDGAAAFKKIPLGQWLCKGRPVERIKNPAWLISDDGVT